MKKLITITLTFILLTTMLISMAACNKTETDNKNGFTELKDSEVLTVKNSDDTYTFKNNTILKNQIVFTGYGYLNNDVKKAGSLSITRGDFGHIYFYDNVTYAYKTSQDEITIEEKHSIETVEDNLPAQLISSEIINNSKRYNIKLANSTNTAFYIILYVNEEIKNFSISNLKKIYYSPYTFTKDQIAVVDDISYIKPTTNTYYIKNKNLSIMLEENNK